MSCLIQLASLLAITQSILVVANGPNWKKCYYTEHSPDKTLQARMGFLRREKGQCKAIFTVKIVQQERTLEEIYHKQHYCEQAKPNEPYVLKHTSIGQFSQGMYQVCVEMDYNQNQNTIIQIFMGERLNPIIYEHSQASIPLIESRQLIDLDLTVQSIKRSLVNTLSHSKASRQKGEVLEYKIVTLMDLHQLSNISQIFSLVTFGLAWVGLIRRFKRDK